MLASKRNLVLLVALVFSLEHSSAALAQDPPNAAEGMNPDATYHVSDFDSIDMATGRLHIHIPLLIDHSQRGNLNFTYSASFSSTGEWNETIKNNGHDGYYSVSNRVQLIRGVTFGMDGYLWGSLDSYTDPNTRIIYHVAVANESDFSVHHFDAKSLSSVAETIDGSGIHSMPGPVASPTLINKDGIQFGLSSFNPAAGGTFNYFIEDPNGNEITLVTTLNANDLPYQTVMTDTLGRPWTTLGTPTVPGTTDVSGCPVAATFATLWDTPGPAGGTRVFKFCYSTNTIQTNLPPIAGVSITHQSGGSISLMTGIVLPDMTTWRFDYDSYGNITKMYLPTGGTISYTWVIAEDSSTLYPVTVVASRTLFDGTNSYTWHYHEGTVSGEGLTLTDPLSNDTVSTYYNSSDGHGGGCQGIVGQIQYYAGTGSGRSLLKTETKTYQLIFDPYSADFQTGVDACLPQSTTTIWVNNQQSKVQLTYDAGFTFSDTNSGGYGGPFNAPYGLVTSTTHYDYGTGGVGPPISTANTSYLALSNSSYLNANLLNFRASETLFTAPTSGNLCVETDYGYDESTADASGVTEQHGSAPNSVRGNLTSITRQLFTNPCSSPTPSKTPLKTTNHIYDTGMLHTSTDPLNNPPTTYSYSGSYYGAYPTSVCNPLNQCTTYGYDFNTGLMTSLKDPNNQTTSFQYDAMLRPTQANYPDTGQTTIGYNYSGNVFVGDTVTKLATPDPSIVTTQVFDGLGRLKETQLTSDPAGTVYTDITYDPNGRKYKVFNPTRCYPAQTNCGETTWGYATYNYDGLNRVTSLVDQDGSIATTNYTSFPCTTVSDEVFRARANCFDGAGRMTGVWEDPGGFGGHLNYQTSYTYDALDNLLSVTQSGSRQRSFTYDSLSRLTQATNPESGTINYNYDANGNMTTKTDARAVTTTYCYDALNRVVGKRYATATCRLSSPDVGFVYDLTQTSWGESTPNSIGRLSWAYNSNPAGCTGSVFGYDALGRIAMQDVSDPVNCGIVGYLTRATYDLAGDMTSLTYPSGRVVTSQYNSAMQPTQVTLASFNGTTIGYNYLSGANYAPTGAPTSLTLGSGATETNCYNNRLQPGNIQIASGASTWLNRTYNFYSSGSGGCSPGSSGNNGNVMSIADNLQPNRTQTFGYDNLNRISSAQSAATSGADCWGQSFGYDAWANLLAENVTKCSGTQLSVGVNTQNRITNSGISYDASGDMLADGVNTYTYDAENRINTLNGTGATYTYDAEGQRVYKQTGGATTEYVYFNGQPIGERQANGDWSDYIYAGSHRLAKADDFEDRIYTFGNHCSGCGNQWAYYTFPGAAGLAGYVIQSGDLLLVRQWQTTGAHGGPDIWFTDGSRLGFAAYDQNGQLINDDLTQQTWNYRRFDISAFAGKTVATVLLNTEGYTQPGNWGIYYQDIALVSADGTVRPIYSREQTLSLSIFYSSGMTGVGYQVNHCCDGTAWPDTTTVYYHGDHLGSQHLMTNTDGYPTWSATYLPFGQEWNPQLTVNHYKFTGKERDSESGLDNFGARYNSSQYGRFMSPDPKMPSLKHLVNPQKWNKYAYTLNNPLRYFDPDGLEEIDIQLRAFIPQRTVSDPIGRTFAGDNRGFSSAANASSRTTITVRIETDASIRANPIISVTSSAGQTRQLDANGNVINSATATTGLPTATGSRDANGNAVLNIQQNTVNPLEPQATPGIRANLDVTVPQNGSSVLTTGTVSGTPSFELNAGGTNIPLQTAPSSTIGFDSGLFRNNPIQNLTPLPPPPPPPPPCADRRDGSC